MQEFAEDRRREDQAQCSSAQIALIETLQSDHIDICLIKKDIKYLKSFITEGNRNINEKIDINEKRRIVENEELKKEIKTEIIEEISKLVDSNSKFLESMSKDIASILVFQKEAQPFLNTAQAARKILTYFAWRSLIVVLFAAIIGIFAGIATLVTAKNGAYVIPVLEKIIN